MIQRRDHKSMMKNGGRAGRALRAAAAAVCAAAFLLLGPAGTSASAEEVKSDAASTIRIQKTEGTVTVADSAGKELTKTDRMRLYSGNHITTEQKSYAWFSLDEDRAVKLDAVSEAEVRKSGKKLEVLLDDGNLFFDISNPLESDEKLNIRTSTMVMGIRGTKGIVKQIDTKHTRVILLEGKLQCRVRNPITGDWEDILLEAGQTADFYVHEMYEVDDIKETSEIVLGKASKEDIEGFVLKETAADPELAEEIKKASGVDVTDVTPEQAQEQLKKDQEMTGTRISEIEKEIAKQDSESSRDPVWEPVNAATGKSTAAAGGSTKSAAAGTSKVTPGTGATKPANTGSSAPGASPSSDPGTGSSSSEPETEPSSDPGTGSSEETSEPEKKTYMIVFKNYDGTILDKRSVNEGSMPVYYGEEPKRPATDEYFFTFSGWTPELTNATADATYTAVYTTNKKHYTVKFVNDDGTVLQSSEVDYGATPSYTGQEPTKAATAQYSYTFDGWTPDITAVTADATYTAKYKETVKKYTVKFVSEDGTVLQSSEVEYGATPSYSGQEPSKAATAQYSYTFDGWTPDIAAVTGDATYTAKFKEAAKKYTVRFLNDDGSVLQSSEVEYGATPSYSGTPTKADTAQTTYTFDSWTPAIAAVTGDADYKAVYKESARKYKITLDTDGGTINSGNVTEYTYGVGASLPGDVTKAADDNAEYTFDGWYEDSAKTVASKGVSATDTGDKTFYAKWNATPKHGVTARAMLTDGTGLDASDVEIIVTVDGVQQSGNFRAKEGATVTVSARAISTSRTLIPESISDGVNTVYAAGISASNTDPMIITFTMGAGDVTVSATFKL